MRNTISLLAAASLTLTAAACGDDASPGPADEGGLAFDDSDVVKVDPGKADTSAEAVFLDLSFAGELVTDTSWNPKSQIEDQLLYTIGQLNGERAVGRLDKLALSEVATESVDGRTVVRYQASILVAWGRRSQVPTTYTFQLPRDVSYTGQQAFTDKYGHDCVDWGAHDVTPGSMWYYYRPARSGCSLDAADVIPAEAAVAVSDVNTTGKYPEYHRIWEDGVFNVVAVFGKFEDGATTASDAGVAGYNRFASSIAGLLRPHGVTSTPADVPSAPGVDVPDITWEAEIDAEHRVVVTSLMVDNVRTAGAEFDARYASLTPTADLIIYNGHAGLGANIRALARKGSWAPGQYVMVFMNGCDTYAYVDSALFDAHAEVNPDDPEGTRYTDIVTNAMPSFFASMAGATMALVKAVLGWEQPLTYEQMFRDVDSSQVVLVSGEQDNEFVPGMDGGGDDGGGGGPEPWAGLDEAGSLGRGEEARFETPALPAGTYTFTMTGSGDADLYVRAGMAPTESAYDCRPYKSGSNEACKVELPSPAAVHVLVRGFSASSTWTLAGGASN